jgi:hypothetical protein
MRTPLKLPVLGFGGDESFRLLPCGAFMVNTEKAHQLLEQAVFIAAGVGITPLLAQAPEVLAAEATAGSPQHKAQLCVLWSLRVEDVPLAVDTFDRVKGLASRTRLFVTGKTASSDPLLENLQGSGVDVVTRRMSEHDVLAPSRIAGHHIKYYICTGAELSKTLLVWLAGQSVVSENFAY